MATVKSSFCNTPNKKYHRVNGAVGSLIDYYIVEYDESSATYDSLFMKARDSNSSAVMELVDLGF